MFARKPPNIKTCPNHISVKYILDATHHAAAKPKRIVQKWKEGNSQCQAGGQAPLLWSVVNLFRPAILFRTHFKIFGKKSWRRPRGRFQGHPHEIVETFRVNGSDGVTQRKGITFLFAKKKTERNRTEHLFLWDIPLAISNAALYISMWATRFA